MGKQELQKGKAKLGASLSNAYRSAREELAFISGRASLLPPQQTAQSMKQKEAKFAASSNSLMANDVLDAAIAAEVARQATAGDPPLPQAVRAYLSVRRNIYAMENGTAPVASRVALSPGAANFRPGAGVHRKSMLTAANLASLSLRRDGWRSDDEMSEFSEADTMCV